MDNARLALLCILFALSIVFFYILYLDVSKITDMNGYRKQVQGEIYIALENFTCIPNGKGCYFHGFYYNDCENIGTSAQSLLNKSGISP